MLNPKFWKKYFKVYDKLNDLISYQELGDAIIDNLEIAKKDKVLDLGSGTGNIAHKVQQYQVEVFGIDFSPEASEIYKKKIPNSQVIVANITQKLPFEDNFFNKIYSNNVIYTIPEKYRESLFKELYRVLKPGGIIVIANPIKKFKPLLIYIEGIKKEIKSRGILKTLLKIFLLIIPTIKIFYYNARIKKENKEGDYSFMGKNDQIKYLIKAGFKNISDNQLSYADQVIINKAKK